jgi:hypothetical protein
MNILYNTYKLQNIMDATVIQGLKALGHSVFSFEGTESNYADLWSGEDYALYVHSGRIEYSEPVNNIPASIKDVPRIFVWGHDSGITREHSLLPDPPSIGFDAYFVKDLRKKTKYNVFPIHLGIEDRYYCVTENTRLPIVERPIDVLFIGKHEGRLYGHRKLLLDALQEAYSNQYNLVFLDRNFIPSDPKWDSYFQGNIWSHAIEYYKLLSQSKIILCPVGASPDAPRHWNALASGGVALIQFMPMVYIQPWLKDRVDCYQFFSVDHCVCLVEEILNDLTQAQTVADSGFSTGKALHTTKARARYLLDCLKSLNLI